MLFILVLRKFITSSIIEFFFPIYFQEIYIPTLWEEPVTTEKKKLPVVVFSHGYGATRFLCSTVCNELASRGFLVAALEHK